MKRCLASQGNSFEGERRFMSDYIINKNCYRTLFYLQTSYLWNKWEVMYIPDSDKTQCIKDDRLIRRKLQLMIALVVHWITSCWIFLKKKTYATIPWTLQHSFEFTLFKRKMEKFSKMTMKMLWITFKKKGNMPKKQRVIYIINCLCK